MKVAFNCRQETQIVAQTLLYTITCQMPMQSMDKISGGCCNDDDDNDDDVKAHWPKTFANRRNGYILYYIYSTQL